MRRDTDQGTGLSHASQDLVFASPPFPDATSGEGWSISEVLLGQSLPIFISL